MRLIIVLFFTLIFQTSFAQGEGELIEFVAVEKSKVQGEFYSFEDLEKFISENEKFEGVIYAVFEIDFEALRFVEPPAPEGENDPDSPDETGLTTEQRGWEKFATDLKGFKDDKEAFNYAQNYAEKELVELALSAPTNSKIPDFLKSTKGLKKDKSLWFSENRFSL